MLKGVGSVRPQAVRGFGDEMAVGKGGGNKVIIVYYIDTRSEVGWMSLQI